MSIVNVLIVLCAHKHAKIFSWYTSFFIILSLYSQHLSRYPYCNTLSSLELPVSMHLCRAGSTAFKGQLYNQVCFKIDLEYSIIEITWLRCFLNRNFN